MTTVSPVLPVEQRVNLHGGWRFALLDGVERALVAALYGWLMVRVWTAYLAQGGFVNLLLLCAEGVVVLLVLIRRPTTIVSLQPGDWLLASGATLAPLLVQPVAGKAFLPPALAVLMMLAGSAVQVAAKVALGRSFGCIPAHRGLKVSGPYRCVRHPMYAGYLLTHAAYLLMNLSVWNAAVYLCCYACQAPRLLAEERLLARDPQYRQYMALVRHRLIPGVF